MLKCPVCLNAKICFNIILESVVQQILRRSNVIYNLWQISTKYKENIVIVKIIPNIHKQSYSSPVRSPY